MLVGSIMLSACVLKFCGKKKLNTLKWGSLEIRFYPEWPQILYTEYNLCGNQVRESREVRKRALQLPWSLSQPGWVVEALGVELSFCLVTFRKSTRRNAW